MVVRTSSWINCSWLALLVGWVRGAQRGCPAGSYSSAATGVACAFCPLGQYSARAGSSRCQLCPRGRYSTTLLGRASCAPCPPGHFASDWGQASCPPCPNGHRQPAVGRAFCLSLSLRYCRAGKRAAVSGVSNSACIPCTAGHFGALSDVTGLGGCFACAKGRFAPGPGAVACKLCPAGRVSEGDDHRTRCRPCAAGRHYRRRSRVELVVGEMERVVTIACDACAVGRFQPARGQTRCLRCAAARFAVAPAALRCRRPAAHEVVKGGGGFGELDTVICSAGHYTPAAGATAAAAVRGSGGSRGGGGGGGGGSGHCRACGAGRFQPRAGASGCLACAPCQPPLVRGGCGTASPGACTACARGRFERRTACWGCPSGSRASCAPCQPCPPGMQRQRCGGRAAGGCEACAAGRFKPAARRLGGGGGSGPGATCKPCPAGTGQLARGQLSCYPTPAPSPAPALPAHPAPVPRAPTTGPAPAARGRSVAARSPHRTARLPGGCPRGRYTTQSKRTTLQLGRVFCLPCPRGKFGWRRGHLEVCSACPFGKTSSPASTQCIR